MEITRYAQLRSFHILAAERTQYGGKYVINPSGGLEAKGHPLGATGIGMHFYITSKVPVHSYLM